MLISTRHAFAQTDLKSKPTKVSNPARKDSTAILPVTQAPIPTDTIQTVKVDSLKDDEDDEPLEHPIVYNARDSIRYETKGQKVFLFGDAFVQYEDMSLKSEFIEIDNEKNTITAYGKTDSLGKQSGNPNMKLEGQESSARKIIYNVKTRKGKIYDIMTKEGDLLLMGSEVKKDSNNVVYMKNLKCIPCEFEDSRTIFKAKKAKIIPDDKIVTGPMYLEIGGVPTPLGLPFGFFPNTKKRHSGLLIPFYGNSDALGFYLKDGGFYWGISDQTDMIIRGDIYSNGSWGLRTTNNYNVNYKFNGSLALGFSEFRNGEKEIPTSYSKQRDISINWRHTQDQKNNPTIRFSSDVNIRTSKYNKYNAQNTGQYLTNTFQSNINFSKTFKIGTLGVNARHDQNTQTRIMNISFPELTFNVNRFYPFKNENRIKQNPIDKIGISYLFEARNTLSGRDTTIFKGNIGDSLKYGFRHTLPISTNITLLKYFTLTPALNLSAVMYTKTTRKTLDESTNRMIRTTDQNFKTGYDANFNTSLSTKLFMDYIFKGKRLKQIRHLLIPSLAYTYRPDFGQEQYGYWKDVISDTTYRYKTKYSIFENSLFGGPAQGTQNSLSVNLNNNLEAKMRKKTDTGFVFNKVTLLQNLSFSGAYNFAADSFKMSNISMTGRTKIWKYFDLVFGSTFDPYYTTIVTNTLTNTESAYRTRQFLINENGRVVDFKSGNIAINASFSSNSITSRAKKPDLTNGAENGATSTNTAQAQERLPWNLNVYYNVTYTKILNKVTDIQTLNFSGDVSITKYWKLGLTSGYDFTNRNLSYTSVNVQRDLRCWQARIDWVPFGFRKSYSLTINLKTSMLSDIKIPRQRQWYDNF
ncbi:MAG: LPS-assembly protein LptD [Bacteroidetes bacterium]|nr:LPS-assembly protein LptD [Bacteroidota bacterium]